MNTLFPTRLEAEQRVPCELGWVQPMRPHSISGMSTSPLHLTHFLCIFSFLTQKIRLLSQLGHPHIVPDLNQIVPGC